MLLLVTQVHNDFVYNDISRSNGETKTNLPNSKRHLIVLKCLITYNEEISHSLLMDEIRKKWRIKGMKRIVALVIIMVMVFSMSGCSTKTPGTKEAASVETSTAPEKEKTMKIGFLVPTLQAEFFVTLRDGYTAIMAENGYEVTTASFEMDSSKAISAIENFIISDVDCIMAMVADNSCDEALKEAMDKGIKVIDCGVETKYYDHCILADNYDVGVKIAEMAADWIKENYDGKCEVAAIVSTQTVDMKKRSDGMIETLQKLMPESKVVASADFTGVGAGTAATENFLQQFPNIKVILSFGSAGALEAVEVFKAAGITKGVAAFACDATSEELKKISAGDIMAGTVDMGKLDKQMADNTIRVLENDPTLEKKFFLKNIKVTADNIADYLK